MTAFDHGGTCTATAFFFRYNRTTEFTLIAVDYANEYWITKIII